MTKDNVNVAFLKMLVALERAGRGLALVALKRTGCDVWQLECQTTKQQQTVYCIMAAVRLD